MKTKNTPTTGDDAQVRAAMRALSKRSLADLRTAYAQTHGKEPGTMKRDALIKSLLKTVATEQPAPSHPTREEQAEAKRRTGPRDARLPAPGTVIEREYKGKTHKVTVNAEDFTYGGKPFRSLTAVAKEVTGYKAISGTLFFGVAKRADAPAKATPTPATPKAAKAPRARKSKKG
jgi:hypothetical protein